MVKNNYSIGIHRFNMMRTEFQEILPSAKHILWMNMVPWISTSSSYTESSLWCSKLDP